MKRRRWRRPFRIATLALTPILLVAGANVAVLQSAAPHVHASATELPAARAAVVPGARVKDDGSPSLALLDRLETARALYASGAVAQLVVSGGEREADAMARWLIAADVPERAVVRDPEGVTTGRTMANARERFGPGSSVVVVTQRFHLSRAVYLARRDGLRAAGLVADRRAYPHQRFDDVREAFARTKSFITGD